MTKTRKIQARGLDFVGEFDEYMYSTVMKTADMIMLLMSQRPDSCREELEDFIRTVYLKGYDAGCDNERYRSCGK